MQDATEHPAAKDRDESEVVIIGTDVSNSLNITPELLVYVVVPIWLLAAAIFDRPLLDLMNMCDCVCREKKELQKILDRKRQNSISEAKCREKDKAES